MKNRDFVSQNYLAIKKANPQNFPILIREASGVQARAFARYGKRIIGDTLFLINRSR